jgi:hypothetical protein
LCKDIQHLDEDQRGEGDADNIDEGFIEKGD